MRAIAVLVGAVLATASPIALQTTGAVVPQPVATPAAANSAQPQLSVSKRGVLLSWIERAGDLATLKFSDDGRPSTHAGAGAGVRSGQAPEHASTMSLRFARFDQNFKQLEETVVDEKVCECCPTTAASRCARRSRGTLR